MKLENLLIGFLEVMGLDYTIDENENYKEYLVNSYYDKSSISFDFKKDGENLIFKGVTGYDYEVEL